jgi:ketosteroid isomerase-like protein
MKTILRLSLFALTALMLIACAPPTNTNTNTNGNTNANVAAKPAAPTAEALMALENKAWEAYKNKDGKYFETFAADSMIAGNGQGVMAKADVAKMISEHKEEVKSFSLSDPHVTPAGADAAVLTYKATVEGSDDGGKPFPSPVTVATVFVRSGSDWKAAYHNEVPVIDPANASGDKKEGAAAAGSDVAGATELDTKPEAKPMANTSSNAASSSSNSSASTGDQALTDTLMAAEKKGWDAWKAKDAKAFDEMLASSFAFVDPMGKGVFSKAEAIKGWTTDNPCNVSSVSLSDGKAQSISKDAAILVVKGNATGTCGDMKIEPLWNTTVFVKEGDTWKVAYIFETPVAKM